MPRLELDQLNKSYGDHRVLHDLSLNVDAGEIYGFVGSNGAGKSTTMRIALGVLSTDSGQVRLDGEPLDDSNRRRIGYMPEERGLYGKESLISQLTFFASLHGIPTSEGKAKAGELLERLGLGERKDDKLDDLSLGNQQRVQLAASLIHSPDVLILDEPFSGLDPVAVEVMSEMLVERARSGAAVLFSSHQLDLVQRLCDRVGILSHGRLVAEGGVEELRTSGPVRYRVATEARGWYPPGCEVVEEGPEHVVLTAEGVDDQTILRAALQAGPVHAFGRVVPDLTELFRDVVSSTTQEA
ncbi:ABC transporter ATP-binding protein [Corynebacterium confusum]|uniref:ABC transporter ATP-binding protein n=1 Tax=Corynebacterium confusum TaxID=71254 RepID=UPI0025B40362|nr:ATP-binding cassette domain-containing protein [Corynebacterium confusum]WJY89263.1 putative ABC transporter ATP-binding protein YxlF [Corynebacterium confusum]